MHSCVEKCPSIMVAVTLAVSRVFQSLALAAEDPLGPYLFWSPHALETAQWLHW